MCRVGYAQFAPRFGDYEHNLLCAKKLAMEASGTDLLVYPELALTGYEFVDADEALGFAEPFERGPTSEELARMAATHSMSIVMGYAEEEDGQAYNSCMLATPGGLLFNYRKLHLFSREKSLFQPGDAPPPVVETPIGRVGLMICFDWFFPETARILALRGAQIIAHPSNLVMNYCQKAMYARSVENHVYTVTANRVGTEERAGRRLTFTGGSQILSPTGDVLVCASGDAEEVGTADIDPASADDKNVTEHNHLLNDRRPDLYTDLG